MSTNTDIARLFNEIAAVLELTGANPFRINAYTRAARALSELTTDVAQMTSDPRQLIEIDGIGDATAAKIVEYVQTGTMAAHEKQLAKVPAGLIPLMGIPGLGPKKVKLLWKHAEVTDLESLVEALDSGAVAKIPGMGEKTAQNIRDSIAFAARSGDRVRLGTALPVAEAIVEGLAGRAGATRVEYAGSLRRGQETIGDIDVLAATDRPDELAEVFRSMPGIEKVLAAGATKSSIRLEKGLQVDLRIVDPGAFGAALLYFTGSKQHNVRLRERAIRRGFRLNEYGLFPDDGETAPPQSRGVTPIAAATEEEIYAALELPWIPAELREDRGELGTEPPRLIEIGDVKSELHAHTTASDGRMTIDELAAEAARRGHHTVAVTDHSKSSAQAGGLTEERLREHIERIRAADARTAGIRILAGAEVDILSDGRLDYHDDLLAELDVVVASPHVALTQDPEKATARLLAAIRHPLVHIIGHPTGRVINRRRGLSPDVDALVEAAVEHDTALEINANFMRLDLRDTHVRSAIDAGAMIAINTDAHSPSDFDHLKYGVKTARRGWVTPEHCVNALSQGDLMEWLKRKR